LGVVAVALALGYAPAFATTITVATTAQSSTTECTLTDAIIAANTDQPSNTCPAGDGPDTIVLGDLTPFLNVAAPQITSDVTIEGNGAVFGGFHLQVRAGGALTLKHVTSAGASCLNASLSIEHSTLTGSRWGGIVAEGCTVTVRHSTINGNGDGDAGHWTGGLVLFVSTAEVINSTISGNYSKDGGGGILSHGSNVTVSNSTISNNVTEGRTGVGGGGILAIGGAVVTLSQSIVSGNLSSWVGPGLRQDEIDNRFFGPDGTGTILADDYNVIGHSGSAGIHVLDYGGSAGIVFTPGHTDIVPGEALSAILGPLADNGGPTQTHALPLGSPAIDVVPAPLCEATADQRGVARPQGPGCDVGAFERAATFAFTGFLAPVANPDTFNFVKAGAAVPVKFQLGGDQGLAILADAPGSRPVTCPAGAVLDPVYGATSTAGRSSLSYDATTQAYTYVWKTDKAWSNSCREFRLTLTDGTEHTALFWFWK
jgi:hypothetical protein